MATLCNCGLIQADSRTCLLGSQPPVRLGCCVRPDASAREAAGNLVVIGLWILLLSGPLLLLWQA